jgi:hypothetical protein
MATDILYAGQSFGLGYALFSEGFRRQQIGFYIEMQRADGNLVLKDQFGRPHWGAGCQNRGGSECRMQSDGNLVVLDYNRNPIWATGTQGRPGAFCRMQQDGNLVIIWPNWNTVWGTGAI